MAELEKRRKRKNSRKDSGGTGGMAGFQTNLGGFGQADIEVVTDAKGATKTQKGKLGIDEVLCSRF